MIYVKKLSLLPLFLILYTGLLYFVTPLLEKADLIFSLDWQVFRQLSIVSVLILTSALIFVVFAALNMDIKLTLPAILISAPLPLIFIPLSLGAIIGSAIALALLISYFVVSSKMNTYLTFSSTAILSPPVKQLTFFLILILSISYYLSANKQILEKGFEIPDSLIEGSLKLMPQMNIPVQSVKYQKDLLAQIPQLTPEQIELLKQNPDLLRQYNIDPQVLDSLPASSTGASSTAQPSTGQPASNSKVTPSSSMDLIKPLVKNQLQSIIDPYQKFIPPVLALLFFLTLQSFTALLSILLSSFIWLTFWTLEKVGFIHFETEMREVKKLVV